MIRLLMGLSLLPTSCVSLFLGAKAMGSLAMSSQTALPFFGGFGLCAAFWLLARYGLCADSGPLFMAASLSRRLYVFGHEMTHALAAWSFGAKVTGFKADEEGGHVDLTESNFIIALAPYCLPLYTIVVVVSYRLLLWWKPEKSHPELFLLMMGATIAFHLLLTFESLWDHRQPDLSAAGGKVFSLSLIGLANGLLLAVLLKALFPSSIDLGSLLHQTGVISAQFWSTTFRKASTFLASFQAV